MTAPYRFRFEKSLRTPVKRVPMIYLDIRVQSTHCVYHCNCKRVHSTGYETTKQWSA